MVPTLTLDWMLDHFPAPDVIKIDVEEAELHVLRGGRRLLETHPVIICEVAGRNAADVHGLLGEYGYAIYDGDQPPEQRKPQETAAANTLALASPGG